MSDDSLTLKQAKVAVDAALAEAKTLGILEAVSVVQPGGEQKAFAADDCVIVAALTGATGKAIASAVFGKNSGFLEANPNNTQLGVADAFPAGRKPIYRQGAVPVIMNGMVLGAVGCGGGTAAQDEQCAQAGVNAILALPSGS